MRIHDWRRVTAGIFHDFHHEWISTIKHVLNSGRLPAGYYAMAEQVAGGLGPDVLTLETGGQIHQDGGDNRHYPEPGLIVLRKSCVVIRHASDHRVVAIVEIVSPGNKACQYALEAFVQKAYEFITAGVHLLVIDLVHPSPLDPQGIHAAVWAAFNSQPFTLPEDKPLTLAAYPGGPPRGFVEPIAVGDLLPDMPLFLEPEVYILLSLDGTYDAAFAEVPQVWRRVLEPPTTEH